MVCQRVAAIIGASGDNGDTPVVPLRAGGDYSGVLAFSRASTSHLDITNESILRDAAHSLAPAVPLLVTDAAGFLHAGTRRPA